jgi:hypothetical protein
MKNQSTLTNDEIPYWEVDHLKNNFKWDIYQNGLKYMVSYLSDYGIYLNFHNGKIFFYKNKYNIIIGVKNTKCHIYLWTNFQNLDRLEIIKTNGNLKDLKNLLENMIIKWDDFKESSNLFPKNEDVLEIELEEIYY